MIVAAVAAAPATALPRPAGAAPARATFGALLEARTSRVAPPPAPAAGRLGAAAVGALERIDRARTTLDGLLSAARAGRTFTAQELLTLQSQAYRYTQAVDLSARLVEQGAQAVKQALQAQV